eukprot:TRINITY_DN4372_c0_g1_i2.p1 TRINITY_DN4372_c0_g1~~TRINITY_DN4372_c0_g1_i2.p1  ORF type:complete len:170 (-),score=26.08 TRINITY_DN4372_c0_g1_i2:27-536(-)
MSSKAVQEVIQRESIQHGYRKTNARAQSIITDLMAKPKENFLRPFAFSVEKVLHRLYSSIHVVENELERLKSYALRAEKEKIPLILLPTHKSHVDYLVISLLFYHTNISLPFIAAGENLNIPILGKLLCSSGAFFIRREFGSDRLYRVIFEEYIISLLEYFKIYLVILI